ncbi:AraC family transcriptional regulator [Actibacterium sp. 188UL27-1]|uniref:helix-turn-helix domain-containing protein n=1 Tax=Actibacterium sp. 188UL27-1 TaxID=2786961 RepID=UPI00195AF271|nr:AraC family transcriptional regulator [Actibacterium sp. 188UL27-1]MBM7069767.1 helix-turn-helix transcriptional regulator [Actibacterium sp. 188UL27-1]
MTETILDMIGTATLAIAVFGVVFCVMRQQFQPIYRSLAWFLVAIALNNVPMAFERAIAAAKDPYLEAGVAMISLVGGFCLAPFFWMYVVTLTSTAPRRSPYLCAHLALPALAACVALLMALMPQDVLVFLVSEEGSDPTGWPLIVLVMLALLNLAFYVQLPVYLYLTVRRLLRYRRQLRDVYASTEQHELRWIYLIGALGVLFWLSQIMDLWSVFVPQAAVLSSPAASGVGFVLFATATLWGLRQRPALVPDSDTDLSPPDADEGTPERDGERYQKSTLPPERSERLARKLRAAMEIDHLYRDPDLSLWSLARHIGASPNHISQTLNVTLGETFFDFVNGYRIAEAMQMLVQTDETVLTITYDVGFNARSSFYTAFKRVTGQTPTGYRKTLSGSKGLDEIGGERRHI